MAKAIEAKRNPNPTPPMRPIITQTGVDVSKSSIKNRPCTSQNENRKDDTNCLPIPKVVRNHPLQVAHRYFPVIAATTPVTTDAGATVKVCGNKETPARIADWPFMPSK
jgi:hypothetical protein